jgi:hypothetical protein
VNIKRTIFTAELLNTILAFVVLFRTSACRPGATQIYRWFLRVGKRNAGITATLFGRVNVFRWPLTKQLFYTNTNPIPNTNSNPNPNLTILQVCFYKTNLEEKGFDEMSF